MLNRNMLNNNLEGMKVEEPIQGLNKPSPSENKPVEPQPQPQPQPKAQLVRHKKDEIVKDLNGDTVNMPGMKWFGSGKNIPMKTVEGEPENADEYANEIASKVWETGGSIENVYKALRKKYKVASALIDKDDATFNDKTIPEDQKKYKYYKHHEWEGPDGKESYYISPLEAAEIKIAKNYGLNLENEGRPLAQITQGSKPSMAAKLINADKELKKNWETFLNNPRDMNAISNIAQAIRKLKDKTYIQDTLMGFTDKAEYDRYVNYIEKSFVTMLNKPGAGEAEFGEAKETKPVENMTKHIATIKAKVEAEDKVKKAEEPAATEIEAEAKKDDDVEDPLKKAEELEQKKYQAPADIKRFSNDLNRFVVQAYLNGDFGKKSSPNAIATMGFFILDKIGAALVNASEVARGMSPSAKSQWSNILNKQTELLGSRITANWFNSLSKTEQEALIRSGVISGTTARTIYETVNTDAVGRAEQKDVLEISKLSQEQKGIAQSNYNALIARKAELQTLITQLRSDQGWEVYTQAMNAIVGTAKGLNSLGVTDGSSSSSQKGFSDTLSANIATGNLPSKFVSGGVSNNSSWNNSSAKALNKSKSLSQDALALSKFKSGESYANATREAKKAANEQLIKRLEGQIEIIDKCIDSWGKDLGL